MNKSKKVVESIFLVSFLVFVISIIPATYSTSSALLSGTAGEPANTPEEAPSPLAPISDGISILSGVVAVISSVYAIQVTRSETRRKEIDRDMQLREVEILKLELALEKERKKKKEVASAQVRKSTRSNQRKTK